MKNTKKDEASLLKLFKKQTKSFKEVTDVLLSQLINNKYSSGKKIKVGDKILYGNLVKDNKDGETYLELFNFNIDEIGKKYVFDKYETIPNGKDVHYTFLFKFRKK